MNTGSSTNLPDSVGIDLDPARRPGVPRLRNPQPWPNAKYPPERMRAEPSAPMHGRPNKTMPPVYGTAVPLHGISGRIRRAAYGYADHWARHWTMILFADRVDVWEHRLARLTRIAAPALAALWATPRLLRAVRAGT